MKSTRAIPLALSIREYNTGKLRADFLAALTVALVALPQSMAHALIAGVPPIYGLYAFIVGSIVGSLLGSSRHLQTGTTNASSVVVGSALVVFAGQGNFLGVVVTLSALAGLIQIGAGVLRLGNLTNFISRSVLLGFIAGAALLIIGNQLPNFLGLPHVTTSSVLGAFSAALRHVLDTDPLTLAIGLGTVAAVVTLNIVSPRSETGIRMLPSYLIAIIAAAAVTALFHLDGQGVRVVGNIRGALPKLSTPIFDSNLMLDLAPDALALALIGLVEAVGSAKAVAAFTGDSLNSDREFLGQGAAKLAVSFLSGMPVSGSPSRSMMNFKAGAETRLSGIMAGVQTLILVLVFAPLARLIPLTALAGVLFVIAIEMINWRHISIALRSTRSDAVALLVTFGAALVLPLVDAIFIGVGLSIILFLRRVKTPRLSELIFDEQVGFQEVHDLRQRPIPEISIVHVEGDIFFGSADFLEEEINKIARREEIKVMILRLKRASSLDATTILAFMQLHDYMKGHGKLLLVSGATGEVERVFRRSGMERKIGRENIYYSDITILKSTRDALARALEFVNKTAGKDYRVRLFYDHPQQAVSSPPAKSPASDRTGEDG